MARRNEQDAFDNLSSRQRREAYFGCNRLLQELPLIGQMHLLDALPNSLKVQQQQAPAADLLPAVICAFSPAKTGSQ